MSIVIHSTTKHVTSGTHDAYNIGDRALFEGAEYESLIDGNSHSPAEYPEGWKPAAEIHGD